MFQIKHANTATTNFDHFSGGFFEKQVVSFILQISQAWGWRALYSSFSSAFE